MALIATRPFFMKACGTSWALVFWCWPRAHRALKKATLPACTLCIIPVGASSLKTSAPIASCLGPCAWHRLQAWCLQQWLWLFFSCATKMRRRALSILNAWRKTRPQKINNAKRLSIASGNRFLRPEADGGARTIVHKIFCFTTQPSRIGWRSRQFLL